MSNSFHIGADVQPSLDNLLAGLGLPDVALASAPAAWAQGSLQIYRPGISTRITEITYRDRKLRVRLFLLASLEDYDLAFRTIEHLATSTGSRVENEEGETFTPKSFRGSYDSTWVRRSIANTAQYLEERAHREGQTCTIEGPARDFHIGPRLYSELEAAGPGPELPYRMIEAMRRFQYIDLSRYRTAGVIEARKPGSSDDAPPHFSFSVLVANEAMHYAEAVEYINLHPSPENKPMLFIPYSKLPHVAGSRFSWLDETNSLVDAIPLTDWPEVLRNAEQFMRVI
jgi:hypothetical protein